MRINTNIPALRTIRQMNELQRSLAQSMRRLASGQRIVEARDDAAGLAMAEGLRSQVRGLKAVALNINQAFGYLNAAEGILSTQVDIVQRMRELALQGSNGTISQSDRKLLETELNQLLAEFNRAAEQATYNGTHLLDGSFGTINLQVGVNKGDQIGFSLGDSRGSAVFTNLQTVGTGSFSLASTDFLVSSPTSSQALGDIDLDGDEDFAMTDFSGFEYLFINDGSGGFERTNLGQINGGVVWEDFNDDGRMDYIASDGFVSSIYLQNSSGAFTMAQTLSLTGSYAKDLDGDGDMDLATYGTAVRQFINDGNGRFTASSATFNSGFSISSGSWADLNGDSLLDMYLIDGLNNRVQYYLANGAGSFGSIQTLSFGAGYTSIALTDLNGDGSGDFVGLHSSNGNLAVRLGNSSGSFTTGTTEALGANYSSLGSSGDVNNDGYDDIFVGNETTNTIAVRLSNGSGGFTSGSTLNVQDGASLYMGSAAIADLDGDGKNDYAVSSSSNVISIFWGENTGTFSASTTVVGYGTNAIDINGDGLLDLAQALDGTTLSGFTSEFNLLRSDRTFAPTTADNSYNFTQDYLMQYLDLNNDGVRDMLRGDFMLSGLQDFYLAFQNTEVLEQSASISMDSQEEAQDLIAIFDRGLEKLNAQRANIGATQNRLESALSNAQLTMENLSQAQAQIMDLDFASETAELTRLQILQQAQVSILGQANSSLRMVLELLKP